MLSWPMVFFSLLLIPDFLLDLVDNTNPLSSNIFRIFVYHIQSNFES
jgi:hypothetical protein